MKRAFYIVTAMLMLAGLATAQNRGAFTAPGSFPHVPYVHAFKMVGTELTKGTYDEMNEKCWGNMFMVAGEDTAMQVQFTYAVDYAGDPNPKTGNLVTTGTWTLAVFDNGIYTGSIYGVMPNGSMTWELYRDGMIANGYLGAKLTITGGTGDYAFVSQEGGTLEAFTDFTGKQPTTGATLSLTF